MVSGYPSPYPDIAGLVTTRATTQAIEWGMGPHHRTQIIMDGFAIGTSGDATDKAIGAKFYTWPVGTAIMVLGTAMSGGLTAAISVTTDTPEVGIGTVVASGANATLTTATWENLIDGGAAGGTVDAAAVAPNVAGGVFSKCNLSTVRPIIATSGGAARDLFLNVAGAWVNVDAAGAVTFTGNIFIDWIALT